MKKVTSLAFIALLLISCNQGENRWENLLDKDMSKWETYLSYPMTDQYNGEPIVDSTGNPIAPLGYNFPGQTVFTIIEENGEPILKVSGEIYGCAFTKRSFKNYHLSLKMKWGDKKFPPRLNEPMDSGILYHSQGECGVDYWRSWKLAQEFQVMEGGCGDYWCIASSRMDIPSERKNPDDDFLTYTPEAQLVPFGKGSGTHGYGKALDTQKYESPKGEWTELELICYEGNSLHIVNGHVVMALYNSSYIDDNDRMQPLDYGQIQLQSEAAELYYKDIQIKELNKIPNKYKQYLSNKDKQ